MPPPREPDHHRPAFWLGLLRVGGRELLEPGLDRGCRDTQELGGAVHRQTAHIQQYGSHFQGQRLAAGGCVGEVQAAALAQVALLGAHQPVLDVLFAPAALASKSHSQSPWRSSSTRKIGHLCRSQTLRTGAAPSASPAPFWRSSAPSCPTAWRFGSTTAPPTCATWFFPCGRP